MDQEQHRLPRKTKQTTAMVKCLTRKSRAKGVAPWLGEITSHSRQVNPIDVPSEEVTLFIIGIESFPTLQLNLLLAMLLLNTRNALPPSW